MVKRRLPERKDGYNINRGVGTRLVRVNLDVVPSNRSYTLLKDSPQVERKLRSAIRILNLFRRILSMVRVNEKIKL